MSGIVVGFTGTRFGMTPAQKDAVERLLRYGQYAKVATVLHGSCQGVDTEAALIAAALDPRPKIVALPGPEGPWENPLAVADQRRPPKGHFARNRDIVGECDVLVVCPKEDERQPRGGTWYTYDYARKVGRRILLVYPGGDVLTIPEGTPLKEPHP